MSMESSTTDSEWDALVRERREERDTE